MASHDTKCSSGKKSNRPTQIFRTKPHRSSTFSSTAIHSLAFHANQLLIGTLSMISAHDVDIRNGGRIGSTHVWQLHLNFVPDLLHGSTTSTSISSAYEVNSLWIDTRQSHLYAGCGNNTMYAIDLSAGGRVIREFHGHDDYIHCVVGSSNNGSTRIFTGSEDGTVRFWDARSKYALGSLDPQFQQEKITRSICSEFGRWIGTVALSGAQDDWLLCGGGPRLALWHLRSLECTNVYEGFKGKVHVSGFIDDMVLAGGGDCGQVHMYSLNGDLIAEIPVSGPTVYTAVWNNKPFEDKTDPGAHILAFGGASNHLDVCTNRMYKDLLLELYNESENEEYSFISK